MNNIFLFPILPIIILTLAIIVAFIVYYTITNKLKINPIKKGDIEYMQNGKYCTEKVMIVLENIQKCLGKNAIAFPNVSISLLIKPKNNLNEYNNVCNKHLDICVFLRETMEPILVIDVIDNSNPEGVFKKLDKDSISALNKLKLPIYSIDITNNTIEAKELKKEILKLISPEIIVILNDNLFN